MTTHSFQPWLSWSFLHNKYSTLPHIFHADEPSWILCNITQSVKWLLGSPSYHSSRALCGTGMVISGNIWFCSYHDILSCLSLWGCCYCLESSAGSLVLLASRQLWEFFCLSCFEALLEKALLSSISPPLNLLSAIICSCLVWWKSAKESPALTSLGWTAVLTRWKWYISIKFSLYPLLPGFPDA